MPLPFNTFKFFFLISLLHFIQPLRALATYHVPTFTVHEIQSGEKDYELKNIITSTGLLAIRIPTPTNRKIEGSKSNNSNPLLQKLCECQPEDFASIPNGDSRILADGLTTRSTIATATAPNMLPLSLPKTEITNHCGADVYDSLEKARDYVSLASLDTFVPALDRLIQDTRKEEQKGKDAGKELQSNIILSTLNDEERYNTIKSIVTDANHLEHFHLYSKKEEEQGTVPSYHHHHEPNVIDNALHWHTDGGLFLAFMPGTSCNSGSHSNQEVDGSFRIALRNDDEIASTTEFNVAFPESNEDEIVVGIMLGAGSEHWLDTPDSLKLRATQHAVKMKGGDVRAWYGMMHLVPPKAIIQKEPTPRTFSEMKKSSIHSVSRTFSDGQTSLESDIAIGCGNDNDISGNRNPVAISRRERRRLQHVGGQDDCDGSSNYFCWLSCLAIPNDNRSIDDHFNNGDSLYCLDPALLDKTGNLEYAVEACSAPDGTAGGIMSDTCQNYWHPSTVGVQSYLKSEDDRQNGEQKYCYGSTSMYMQGFEWEGTSCVVYLFSSWILSSRGAFIGACFGTIIVAMLTEIITRHRRSLLKRVKSNGRTKVLASAFLYAIQVSMGYAVMLLIMTYSGPLVLSVILGLTLGHIITNWDAKSAKEIEIEGSTPCCNYLGDEEETDSSQQNVKSYA